MSVYNITTYDDIFAGEGVRIRYTTFDMCASRHFIFQPHSDVGQQRKIDISIIIFIVIQIVLLVIIFIFIM